MKKTLIQLNYLLAISLIIAIFLFSAATNNPSNISVILGYIGIFFIASFGMKFNIFGAKIWYTKSPKSIGAETINVFTQIFSWLMILQLPSNYSSARIVPIFGLMISFIIIFPTTQLWKFRFSRKIPSLTLQAMTFLVIAGSLFNGLSTLLIKTLVNAPESTRFLFNINLAIIMGFLLIRTFARYNDIKILKKQGLTHTTLRDLSLVLIVHVVLLALDTGIWNHAITTWKITSMGFFVGIYAGIIEEFIVRGLILGFIVKRFSHVLAVWQIIILQAFIFSFPHILSIISSGNMMTAISAVISVIGLGILWAIIYLAFGELWIVMILHGLWDIIESIITQQSNFAISGGFGMIVALCELTLSLVFSVLLYNFYREKILTNISKLHH